MVAAGIGYHALQCLAHLIKDTLKACTSIIIEIILNGLAVIGLRLILSVFAVVIPVLHVVELVSHTFNRNRINSGTGAAIGRKGTQCIICFL